MIKSRNPLIILFEPYFVFPLNLWWCLTLISPILAPFVFKSEGIYLCISPYRSTSSNICRLYALNVHPESCILSFMRALRVMFATFEIIFLKKIRQNYKMENKKKLGDEILLNVLHKIQDKEGYLSEESLKKISTN